MIGLDRCRHHRLRAAHGRTAALFKRYTVVADREATRSRCDGTSVRVLCTARTGTNDHIASQHRRALRSSSELHADELDLCDCDRELCLWQQTRWRRRDRRVGDRGWHGSGGGVIDAMVTTMSCTAGTACTCDAGQMCDLQCPAGNCQIDCDATMRAAINRSCVALVRVESNAGRAIDVAADRNCFEVISTTSLWKPA
jgi:hypothetical protein